MKRQENFGLRLSWVVSTTQFPLYFHRCQPVIIDLCTTKEKPWVWCDLNNQPESEPITPDNRQLVTSIGLGYRYGDIPPAHKSVREAVDLSRQPGLRTGMVSGSPARMRGSLQSAAAPVFMERKKCGGGFVGSRLRLAEAAEPVVRDRAAPHNPAGIR